MRRDTERRRAAALAVAIGLCLTGCAAPDTTTSATTSATSPATLSGTPASPGAASDGVIAWNPLPASGRSLPQVTVPPSPAPTSASGLPPCRAADLTATAQRNGAAGTTLLSLTLTARAGVRCQVSGSPETSVRITGRSTAVIAQHRDFLPEQAYTHAVAVDPQHPAVVTLWWSTGACPALVAVTAVDLALPGGRVRTTGDGALTCAGGTGAGGVATRAPELSIGTFAPQDATPERVGSPLADVDVALDLPAQAPAGGTLDGVMALTARGHDVALAPCPDVELYLATAADTWQRRYALDCAAVTARTGEALLRAGVAVRFALRWSVPAGATGSAKVGVTVDPPDGIGSAGGVRITP